MKNNFLIIFFLVIFSGSAFGESLNIQSINITIDKKTKLTIFKNDVVATDPKNNVLKTQYAEYNKDLELLESKDSTTIKTSEGYLIDGKNILFDNKNYLITSKYPAIITDLEKNNISLENFEYSTKDNFFKSTGNIKVIDSKNNTYNFSQIYIDEKKREIVGSDIKAFLNQESFKINEKNKPRIFANTVKIDDVQSQFTKSVFTLCDYRKEDKCPPWSIQAKKMRHDKIEKTIFYDNAVIKFYDLPIFYFPILSHPDPNVDRRSGFLIPTFSDTKNLGTGLSIPYFWALNKDKDLTTTGKMYASESPLVLAEYRQAFKESNLILDMGYTEGYRKSAANKSTGDKSHAFMKFVKNFKGIKNSENNFELSLQDVSDDKYLKLYKIETNLASYETEILEKTINFSHENDDFFLGFNAGAFESLKDNYNDKYEYILPDLIINKNLFSNEYGNADFTTNLKVHNYDTNKSTNFFINDIDWKYKNLNLASGFKGNVLGKLKNVNYEAKNVNQFKEDSSSEIFGALGYLAEVDFFKKSQNKSDQFLTPKILVRYAPGHMRKEPNGSKLNYLNIFSLDRLNSNDNFESGLSTTLGFDYKLKNKDKELNFTVGQIINNKENKDMPSSSSLDEKLSDLVGRTNYKVNDSVNLNYNFSLDQNYKDLNYNEIGADLALNPAINFNFSYLQEKKHIGDQEYLKTKIDLLKNTNGIFSAETKRNLVTNSSEYYNLSYEYLNDCLRAGIVYRREFYEDSELESENSLMFKLTFIPFGNINSPAFNR